MAERNGIQRTSPLYLWFRGLSYGKLYRAGLRFLGTVLVRFFGYQFQTVLNRKIRPVVNVDHPLDKEIPFDPGAVKLYLTFTAYWMKAAGFLLKKEGPAIVPALVRFIDDLNRAYWSAGEVYRRCQSTTERPAVQANFRFVVIHLFDPHLHCVPSLHVMVVGYVSYMFSKLVREEAADPEGYRKELDYVYRNSVDIIDSVLFVKQHSVNCLPAGIFMLSSLFPEFADQWADPFLDDIMKQHEQDLPAAAAINQYCRRLYSDFVTAEQEEGKSAPEVLLDFLEDYQKSRSGGKR